ncbi:MAG: aminotransferase class I/II-fold pyridoxal phosphate-dependent enzyme, partial [Planctomycetaceae bacterium]|nr:aminotransferase class I/II-fold pyridoxal phosphate-dependent enzyme [Planctomycetaceae bacterium]
RHDQSDRLRQIIQRRRQEFEAVFLVTDSIFSMDGIPAPLELLCDLADEWDLTLIVDEAHGTGVFGETGAGLCEATGLSQRVDLRIGTLSKAFGLIGGFAAGDRLVCDQLWNTARSQFFSTSLPPAICAAAIESLRIIREDHARRAHLHHLCRHLRALLAEHGLPTIAGSEGPIVPVLVGDDAKAVDLSQQLEQDGFLVPAVRPPTVPAGTARLRISLCSQHQEEQLEQLVNRFAVRMRDFV